MKSTTILLAASMVAGAISMEVIPKVVIKRATVTVRCDTNSGTCTTESIVVGEPTGMADPGVPYPGAPAPDVPAPDVGEPAYPGVPEDGEPPYYGESGSPSPIPTTTTEGIPPAETGNPETQPGEVVTESEFVTVSESVPTPESEAETQTQTVETDTKSEETPESTPTPAETPGDEEVEDSSATRAIVGSFWAVVAGGMALALGL